LFLFSEYGGLILALHRIIHFERFYQTVYRSGF